MANWSVPKHISALTTTRISGCSQPPYASNNLALHVGDDPILVQANRHALQQSLALPGEPAWLEQTHSNRCIIVEDEKDRMADAAITRTRHIPLVIMTADCLPILLCDQTGSEIAAIHAGWRGLMHGVIQNTLEKMQHSPQQLIAWIGPAICQTCYEVNADIEQAFTQQYPDAHEAFLHRGQHIYADLAKIAELVLSNAGVPAVYQSNACTYELTEQFYSYRRTAQTGRIATLIWFNQPDNHLQDKQ